MIKNKKLFLITFFITVFILGWIFFFIDFFSSDYKIILNGEEVKEFIKCDNYWNYKNKSFIPCVWNETIKGIPENFINWSLSPQENCHRWNGTFPGFNLDNETRNKELYDEVMPICTWFNAEDIDEEFLSECECINEDNCLKYKCSENLEIIKR